MLLMLGSLPISAASPQQRQVWIKELQRIERQDPYLASMPPRNGYFANGNRTLGFQTRQWAFPGIAVGTKLRPVKLLSSFKARLNS